MSISLPNSAISVAVLLAAYNGRQWLAEQLESLFQQRAVSVTIFVSVDESSDGTAQWLSQLALTEPRLKLLVDNGRMGSAARNFFRLLRDVDITQYDYVAFADQDDIWLPTKLSRAVECLQKGYDGYSSDVTAFWPDGRKKLIKKSQPQQRWDFLFESPGPGCTFVMKASFVSQLQRCVQQNWTTLQGFDYHDWFVYAFARANGFTWIIDEQPSILYRQHASNVVGANTGLGAFWSRARYVLRGGGFSQAILLTRLLGLNNEPFVRLWSARTRYGYLKLALHARQCRRHKREQLYFFLLCILSVLFPS